MRDSDWLSQETMPFVILPVQLSPRKWRYVERLNAAVGAMNALAVFIMIMIMIMIAGSAFFLINGFSLPVRFWIVSIPGVVGGIVFALAVFQDARARRSMCRTVDIDCGARNVSWGMARRSGISLLQRDPMDSAVIQVRRVLFKDSWTVPMWSATIRCGSRQMAVAIVRSREEVDAYLRAMPGDMRQMRVSVDEDVRTRGTVAIGKKTPYVVGEFERWMLQEYQGSPCPQCQYDRTGIADSCPCPECGYGSSASGKPSSR